MKYKMIFCDVDGTLIDSNHRLSKNSKIKIKDLYKIGIPFVLVSARAPSGIIPLQYELGISAPIVCYSGALIISSYGKPVKSVEINSEKAMLINNFIEKKYPDICLSAYSFDDWITQEENDKRIKLEQKITGLHAKQERISDIIAGNRQIHKFLCLGEAKEIKDIDKVLKEEFKSLSIYRSKDTYLEIMDGTVSKARAVKYLCKMYNIPIEAAVSFGDNFNDVDMLQATGTSFAMGNAPEVVKKKAKNITLDNDHDGVVKGLEKLNFE